MAFGQGTRRKKLADFLKSANELRQSYQQSYGLSGPSDGSSDYDNLGMPGAFPDVAIARSGEEEMILFPSYARRHVPRTSGPRDLPGSIHDGRDHEMSGNTGYVKQEWDRYEEANSVIDVDVRGWIYSPPRGSMSRYNRAMIALARRMSGVPAPSNSRAQSPNSAHHLPVTSRHEQDIVDKEAESITRKGDGEQQVAWHGGYSEPQDRRDSRASIHSSPGSSRTPSPGRAVDAHSGTKQRALEKTSALEDADDAPGPGLLAKRASWNHPSDMSSSQLSIANAHMMLRLKPFLTTPLTSTPLTVFFYNEKTSRSRTIYTNDAGHFNLRAALDFVPTNVRVLASDKLSATDEIHVTEPHGVSLISDVDDTIKHSAIGAGAREVFRNVFIRDLGDLHIDGVKEWYTDLANRGVKLHYVSNMPWQLFPVLMSFLNGAGLPKGSFHLKHYTGMLQGIFEPVAERKKGTLDRIISDFPTRRFILVGDSGEADLELYTEIVEANPGRVLGVFIRDVTSRISQGFFDSSVNAHNDKDKARQPLSNSSGTGGSPSRLPDFEPRPRLPPRQQTRFSSSLNKVPSGPPMGQLIDFEEDEKPSQMKGSITDTIDPSEASHESPVKSTNFFPPHPPSKPSILRSSTQNDIGEFTSPPRSTPLNRRPPPPRPPKPRKLSAEGTHVPSPLSQAPSTPSSSPAPTYRSTNPKDTSDNRNTEISPDRQSYRASVRSKVSSVYNHLPSLYPTDTATRDQPRPTPDRSFTSSTTSISPSSSSEAQKPRPPPPIPARRNLSSYPAAAAQYATQYASHRWNGTASTSSSGSSSTAFDGTADNGGWGNNNGGGVKTRKEELWAQRWERAKRVMEREGVVLRSWRVGGDVRDVAVGLVERAVGEEGGEGSGGVRG